MSDRLEEIKAALEAGNADEWWSLDEMYHLTPEQHAFYTAAPETVSWLLAEVERLREKNDRQVFYGQRSLDVAEEIVAPRGALQALVDAAWPEPTPHTREEVLALMEQLEAARAAAVALLAGPGGET